MAAKIRITQSQTDLDNAADISYQIEDGPTPLRVRKKQQQNADLLRIAVKLFRRRGYEQTRMEDIAVQASVSTKTVYNYFPTKQQLLIALLNQDRVRMQMAYEKVVSHPPDDPAEALALLIRADVGYVRSVEDKRLWREMLGAATQAHDRSEEHTSELQSLMRISYAV